MIWMLNIDVAIGAMRSAFRPLSCAVEVYDYQKLVLLRVFDPDNTAVHTAQQSFDGYRPAAFGPRLGHSDATALTSRIF